MEAIINCLYERHTVHIYLREGGTFWGYDGEKMIRYDLNPTEAPSEDMKPFLVLPLQFATPILEAITKSAKEKGISTEDENHLRGRIKATELHLSDMRELTKLLVERQVKV